MKEAHLTPDQRAYIRSAIEAGRLRRTARFLLLADNPYLGRARDALRPGLRSFPVGGYVIIYRIADDKDALILHAVRGSRDIEGMFGR